MLARIGTVGGLTLLSRLFGFLRDILMTALLGAGAAADAFVIAFKLPNFFRRLFAEGAFSAGFVPFYARILGEKGQSAEEAESRARAFAEDVLAWFVPVLLLLLLIMEVGMVGVIQALTGGFDDNPGKFDLTVQLARLTFPYLVAISLVSLFAGILAGHNRFASNAFAPVLLNISMIAAMLLSPPVERDVARYLAIAVATAGFLQMLWLWANLYRLGLSPRLRLPRFSPQVSDMMRVIGPAALGAGVIQVNLLIDLLLAAYFLSDGAVSWLFYGDRLNQLTVGVVGVAIGTVLLPTISRLLAADDTAKANQTMNQAIRFGLLVALPSAVGLIVIAGDIITTLFERGAFTTSYAHQTALALIAYASGLPAYILLKILAPGFFARKDTQTPVKVAMVALLVNLVTNLSLIGPYGHVGLALGTSIAAWVNCLLLGVLLLRRGHLRLSAQTIGFVARVAILSVAMGTSLLYGQHLWQTGQQPGELDRIIRLSGLIGSGILFFGVGARLFGLFQFRRLKATLRGDV